MDNKFKSNSPDEAKAWLEEMFAQGAEWVLGGQEIKHLDSKYFFCTDDSLSFTTLDYIWRTSPLPEYSPIITPDFSNVQVGDRVKCFAYGDGVVVAVDINGNYPIYVKFLNGMYSSYTFTGRFSSVANPTLFYHFEGQFPTAEACVRPKPTPYEHWQTPIILGGSHEL